MATYDGRLKSIRDTDLFFWEGAGTAWTHGPTLSSSSSSVSDIIDLGADQVFINHPAVVMFDATDNFSCMSQNSTAITLDRIYIPGFFLQDAADGSTFSDIAFVKFPATASYAVTATAFSEMTLGVVKIRQYARLYQKCGIVGGGTYRAWLRLGLTK